MSNGSRWTDIKCNMSNVTCLESLAFGVDDVLIRGVIGKDYDPTNASLTMNVSSYTIITDYFMTCVRIEILDKVDPSSGNQNDVILELVPAHYFVFVHDPRLAVVNFQAPEINPYVFVKLTFDQAGLGFVLNIRKQELVRSSDEGCALTEPAMTLGKRLREWLTAFFICLHSESCWQHFVFSRLHCVLPWDKWTWVRSNQTCQEFQTYFDQVGLLTFKSKDHFLRTTGCQSLCRVNRYIYSTTDSFVGSYFSIEPQNLVRIYISYLSSKVSVETVYLFAHCAAIHEGRGGGGQDQLRL